MYAQYFPPAPQPATQQPSQPGAQQAPQSGTQQIPQTAGKKTSTPSVYALDLSAPPADDPNLCPNDQRPPISALPDTRKSFFRRSKINGDYLVLEYNARPDASPLLQTRWYDYREWYLRTADWATPQSIVRNGSFIPVVYAKEKILVHVCGLKFTDLVTVTNNPTGLPEGGADIRGGAAVTAVPTLGPALDSLQTVGITGGATSIGGLGFSATPALTSASVTGITQGTISHGSSGLTYNDVNITASPEELALLMYAAARNGLDLADTIRSEFNYKHLEIANALTDQSLRKTLISSGFDRYPPNHLDHITAELEDRLDRVKTDAGTDPFKSSPARFDQDLTNVQNLSSELSTFFASVASQGFGARAVVIWNNYALLRGPLDLIQRGPTKNDCVPRTEAVRTQELAEQAGINAADTRISADAAAKKLAALAPGPDKVAAQKDYDTKKKAADAATAAFKKAVDDASDPVGTPSTPSTKTINCDDWEKTDYAQFLKQYHKRLEELIRKDPNPNHQDEVRNWEPYDMFKAIFALRQDIDKVTEATGELFAQMNQWNDNSNAEQSDFITPVSANALARISIVVQHGYTPFILTTYTATTAPTATVPTSPTATTIASTSTPAHAVKTVLVEVHRRANFNLVGGAMLIRVPNSTYAVQAGATPVTLTTTQTSGSPTLTMTSSSSTSTPTGSSTPVTTYTYTYTYNYTFQQVYSGTCAANIPGTVSTSTAFATSTSTISNNSGTAPTSPPSAPTNPPNPPGAPSPPGYSCVVQTQTGKTQVAGMVGMAWFPLGRDYFPRRNGLTIYKHDLIPSLFAATSVTSLGNAAFGFDFEPFSGIDFMIGEGSAHSTVLPVGITTSTVLPSGYTLPTVTQVHWKPTIGFGLDLGVFMQLFTKGGSSAGLP